MAPGRAVFVTPVVPQRAGMGLAMRAAAQLAALLRLGEATVIVIPVIGGGAGRDRFHRDFPGAALEMAGAAGQEDPYWRMIARLADAGERLFHFARYGKPSLAAGVTGRTAAQVAAIAARDGARHVHVFRSYLAAAADAVPAEVIRTIDLDEDDPASFRSSAAVLSRAGRRHAAEWARLEAEAFDRLLAQKLGGFRLATLANREDVAAVNARSPHPALRALPNGVEVPPLPRVLPRSARPSQTILFVGSLRYEPNVDGLLWFIREVLPRLPGACLRIVGRSPAPSLARHARPGRVAFSGYMDDLAPAYRAAALAIAPMRSGGGTRIKILEAGAHGVPVVATPESAAGLWPGRPGWGIVARGPRAFAAACGRLLANRGEAHRLGLEGRHCVPRLYGRARIEDRWFHLFQDIQKGQTR